MELGPEAIYCLQVWLELPSAATDISFFTVLRAHKKTSIMFHTVLSFLLIFLSVTQSFLIWLFILTSLQQ